MVSKLLGEQRDLAVLLGLHRCKWIKKNARLQVAEQSSLRLREATATMTKTLYAQYIDPMTIKPLIASRGYRQRCSDTNGSQGGHEANHRKMCNEQDECCL